MTRLYDLASPNYSSQLATPGHGTNDSVIINNTSVSEHMPPPSPIGHPPASP